jgi:hypothetical protein
MKESERHVIKSSGREGVCTVTEYPDRIELHFTFSRYGQLNDETELMEWLFSIFDRYEGGDLPIEISNHLTPGSDAAVAASFKKWKLAALNIALGDEPSR